MDAPAAPAGADAMDAPAAPAAAPPMLAASSLATRFSIASAAATNCR